MSDAVECLCCGKKTLTKRGFHEICRVCMWEDDPSQAEAPDLEGGANGVSLNQARANYRKFGSSEPRFAKGASQ
jgi:hypothetical protein